MELGVHCVGGDTRPRISMADNQKHMAQLAKADV
jgi:hypothetical protein